MLIRSLVDSQSHGKAGTQQPIEATPRNASLPHTLFELLVPHSQGRVLQWVRVSNAIILNGKIFRVSRFRGS